MPGHGQFCGIFFHPVESLVQYLHNDGVVIYAIIIGSFTGIAEAFVTYLTCQTEYAGAGFIGLFRVWFVL